MEDAPSLNGETPRLGYHWRLVHRAHSIRVAKVIMGGQIYIQLTTTAMVAMKSAKGTWHPASLRPVPFRERNRMLGSFTERTEYLTDTPPIIAASPFISELSFPDSQPPWAKPAYAVVSDGADRFQPVDRAFTPLLHKKTRNCASCLLLVQQLVSSGNIINRTRGSLTNFDLPRNVSRPNRARLKSPMLSFL